MDFDTTISRRGLLAAAGGVAGLVGVGYASARHVARDGIINGRVVMGLDTADGTIVGQTKILQEFLDSDGPPDRQFDPDYRQAFPAEPPMTVSSSFHRKLSREFDEVAYALSHSCPDAVCSTPNISRDDFNGARLGEEVSLLYHSGDKATVIP